MADRRPLVLDVDGTLLRTDLLYETFWAGLGRDPFATLLCLRHIRQPALLKRELAEIAPVRTDLMPVNDEVLEVAAAARSEGREIVLASASDAGLVARVAADHRITGAVMGSEGGHNLKGPNKARALIAAYGKKGFYYAGDAAADRPVWEASAGAVVVGQPRIAATLEARGLPVTQIAGGWTARDLIKALRPHQWVKNVLLLLPMIAAHEFELETLLRVMLGIVAFSLAASSIYIVNDLLDLEADRLHPTKSKRPFASGAVPIQVGMVAFAVTALLSLGLSALLGWAFLGVIAVYIVLSLAYSLRLKRLRWIDIASLAALYTLRVVAGAAASQVEVSMFMLIFIFPVFITLGCVKRLTELTLATSDERLPGRGYGRPDRGDLLNVASLGIVGALLIFFLYSLSDHAIELYPTQWILWLALIPIAIWLIRMVVLGYLGRQDYDPIVFAMRDKMGLGILMITLSLMFYAAGLWAQWFSL